MRLLVYGAGVIGCELAHELCKGNNDVTLLARGAWKESIDEKGLVIRHYVQLHTTRDTIKTIDILDTKDRYDCIFVVMQYVQVKKILSILAENESHYIVLVGNNMIPEFCENQILSNSLMEKEIAFGFQGTAGRRENGRVVSIHINTGMTIGGIKSNLSSDFHDCITKAFSNTGYRLTWERHMEGWLICHMAFILPICYICYALDCDLKKVSKKQISMVFDATIEAHEVLKKLGIPIRPDNEEEYFTKNRKKNQNSIYFIAKTSLGKLVASDHCSNAIDEMKDLDQSFEKLRKELGVEMPVWNNIRKKAKIFE